MFSDGFESDFLCFRKIDKESKPLKKFGGFQGVPGLPKFFLGFVVNLVRIGGSSSNDPSGFRSMSPVWG